MSTPRQGFSLLELLVAVALGTLLLLIAVTTVRSVSQGVRNIARTASVNTALRTAWMQGMADADFWHSHADPKFPYGKWFASDDVAEQGQYRPFRPWRGGSATMAAINPASWDACYIGRALPDTIALQPSMLPSYVGNEYRIDLGSDLVPVMSIVVAEGPDPITNQPWISPFGYDARTKVKLPDQPTRARGSFLLPAGWDPWHMVGSYAQLANVANHRGQAQQWETYAQIGHQGCMAYAEPGTVNLIAMPTANRQAFGDRSAIFPTTYPGTIDNGWGEIPFSLKSTVYLPRSNTRADSYHYIRGLPGPVMKYLVVPASLDEVFRRRGDGLDLSGSIDEAGFRPNYMGNPMFWSSEPMNRFGGNLRQFAMDLDLATATWLQANYPRPLGSVYSARIQADGNAEPTMIDWLRDPMRVMWSDNDRSNPNGSSRKAMREVVMARNSHMPFMATDGVASPPPTPGVARSRHDIARYRARAMDQVYLRLSAQSADGDVPVTLVITPLATTYRGARMYWGTATEGQSRRIGDIR